MHIVAIPQEYTLPIHFASAIVNQVEDISKLLLLRYPFAQAMFSVRYQLLLFLSFYVLVRVKADLFYDAESCRRRIFLELFMIAYKLILEAYETLLDKAFTSAFTLVEHAIEAVEATGQADTPGALWTFPDSETRDLAARIFGSSKIQYTIPDRMNIIKSKYESLLYTECEC
jgi:hypothetical protein